MWFSIAQEEEAKTKPTKHAYGLHTLVQKSKHCDVFRGNWLASSNCLVARHTRIIVKRVTDSHLANAEIDHMQKLMHKINPLKGFFAPMVHWEMYKDATTDIVFEDVGEDLLNHFFCFWSFSDIASTAFDVRAQHVSFVMSRLVECVLKLHLLGYAHNDIKPENACIDATQHVKLIDFTYMAKNATVNDHDLHFLDGCKIGSEVYMHPALLWDEPLVLFDNDWWAVAMTAFVLLTNSFLFNPETTSLTERRQLYDALHSDPRWDRHIEFADESIRQHAIFPSFVRFVAKMCCTRLRSSEPTLLLLQDPFLTHWRQTSRQTTHSSPLQRGSKQHAKKAQQHSVQRSATM